MLLANFTCAYRIIKDLLIVCYTKKEPFLQGFFGVYTWLLHT